MGTSEHFTRADVLRILNISERQLGTWEKMQFVPSLSAGTKDYYDFRDLIRVRTTKQLIENGVPPTACAVLWSPFSKSFLRSIPL